MLRAFQFGAPPHGGIAPGVDRIVMLLADEPNIRETIAFPLNGNAQDLMMGAPTELEEARLRELNIALRKPVADKDKYRYARGAPTGRFGAPRVHIPRRRTRRATDPQVPGPAGFSPSSRRRRAPRAAGGRRVGKGW